MTERNAEGCLTSTAQLGEAIATHGLIDHIRSLDVRVKAIEDKLWPPVADGSGTERYDGSGTGRYADNWTQVSDGSDYPGSYGVWGLERKPFVPLADDAPEAAIEPVQENTDVRHDQEG
jgi:hypothetical protein